MTEILIIKTGALGDVLRTTAILRGLAQRYPGARITWLTAPGALELVERHPCVARALGIDTRSAEDAEARARELERTPFARIVSLDDELPLCALATRLDARARAAGFRGALVGAHVRPDGARGYSADSAAWFDMGLLSVHGKQRADELKVLNRQSQPAIYAQMLGIAMGEPELPLRAAEHERARRELAQRMQAAGATHALGARPLIGLNTGAGGRWESKKLSVERTVALAEQLSSARGGALDFLLLGGRDERERNDAILALARASKALGAAAFVDAGTEHSLLGFAALVDALDLLVTSDSLALHVACARRVPVVAFFAPTSAAEIEFYGRGEAVCSTSPDYCSYKPDARNDSITPERVAAAALRWLGKRGARLGAEEELRA
jgi:heptosyltransferase-2